jgi:hypothetical protein
MDKTHNSRFLELQDEYLKTRDEKYLNQIYLLCVEMAANYIRKYARERGLNLDIVELAHDSAVYVIAQYLRKPEWRVEQLSAYMYHGYKKVLFDEKNKNWEQRTVSYDNRLIRAELVYTDEGGRDESGTAQDKGVRIKDVRRPARRETKPIKQGLLFEDSEGKGYEEIYV